jgi:excisionase family DNA binding protein
MTTKIVSEFLTTRQLQEILHVDRTTIYRMADDGRVPAVKVSPARDRELAQDTK